MTAPETAPIAHAFTLAWTTQHASALIVKDQSGAIRYTAGPLEIASGSCLLGEGTGGPKTYTVIATGALGHTVAKDVEVTIVSADFVISQFTASEEEIEFDAPVTLSWKTGDAEVLRLYANGVEIPLPPTIDPDEDSFTLLLQESTTFDLEIEHTLYGTRRETVSVVVCTATLALTPSATNVRPGVPVSIAWAVLGDMSKPAKNTWPGSRLAALA